MSKPVKELIRKELVRRLRGITSLAVVGFTGINAVTIHQIRQRLRGKDIRLMVVRNAMARQAFDELGIPQAKGLFDGPCSVAYVDDQDRIGLVELVRELLEIGKDTPNLKVKAALMDGEPFGADRVEALSKFPTRPEALGILVGCLLSPGARLAGCLIGPPGRLVSVIEAIGQRSQAADSGGEQAA
jgi:large subunit ribosomal protein L10